MPEIRRQNVNSKYDAKAPHRLEYGRTSPDRTIVLNPMTEWDGEAESNHLLAVSCDVARPVSVSPAIVSITCSADFGVQRWVYAYRGLECVVYM